MPTFKQQTQATCPKQCPNKPETKFNQPTNATKGTTIARVHVPNKALKEKGCCLDTKSPAANECRDTKSPVQKRFQVLYSEKQRTQQKREEERLSGECSRKKCKKKVQYAIYRGIAPRKNQTSSYAIIETTYCLGIHRVGGSS